MQTRFGPACEMGDGKPSKCWGLGMKRISTIPSAKALPRPPVCLGILGIVDWRSPNHDLHRHGQAGQNKTSERSVANKNKREKKLTPRDLVFPQAFFSPCLIPLLVQLLDQFSCLTNCLISTWRTHAHMDKRPDPFHMQWMWWT